jgi:4-amino-4-deoxy-L-arabinose transferase-like glycosyltransferase
MLLLSFILVLLSSLFFVSLLKCRAKISYLLGLFLFSWVNLLLTGHLGHLLSLMNSTGFYLAVEGVLLLAAVLLWWLKKKPSLLGPFKNAWAEVKAINPRKHWDLLLLLVGVVVGLAICAVLAYWVPPNNNDSVSTHTVRILYWLQHGNYEPWATPRTWQVIYPVNAQLVMFWTMLFTRGDHWAAFVQLAGGIAAALSVTGIAREMFPKNRAGAVFSGLLFLTLPVVTLQLTTTQNDLITAAVFGLSFYFFVYAVKHDDLMHFILSGLSVGIALGTKQTVFFLLPGWGLVCLLLWLVYKKVTFKRLLTWAVTILVAFTLLGSQIYLMNYREYGNIMGPADIVEQATGATNSVGQAFTQVKLNISRFLFQFADPSGLPSPFWRWGIKGRALVGEKLFDVLNLPLESEQSTTPPHRFYYNQAPLMQEDEAWYGLLGFVILVPTLLAGLIGGIKRKEPVSVSIFVMTATYFIFLTLLRPGWDPYQGRYFMPVMLLCTSLFAFWFTGKRMRWVVAPASTIISLLILVNAVLYNPAKPILGHYGTIYYRNSADPGYTYLSHRSSIFVYDRLEMVTFQTSSTLPVCEIIEQSVPADATMGYMINSNYYQEYCFFGETFRREIVPLQMDDMGYSGAEMDRHDVGYILYYLYPAEEIVAPEGFSLIAANPEKQLFIYAGE